MTKLSPFCFRRALLSLVVPVLGLVACAGEEETAPTAVDATPRFTMVASCAETYCEAKRREADDRCDQCMNLCFQLDSCDFSSQCALSCGGSAATCTSSDNGCFRSGYAASAPIADPEILAACDQAATKLESCGYALGSPCAKSATVERPDVIPWYLCMAGVACAAKSEAYVAAVQACADGEAYLLGTAIQEVLGNHHPGQKLSEDARAFYDHNGSWLRDDVRAAGLACAALPVLEQERACLSAWDAAIR